jgi:hypothetical protein
MFNRLSRSVVCRHQQLSQTVSEKKAQIGTILSTKYKQVGHALSYVKYTKYIGAAGVLGYFGYVYGTLRTETITVKTKIPLYGGGTTTLMLSSGKDKMYRVKNSYWHLQLRAIELYSKLEEGKKYNITIYGARIRPFHIYPNIVGATEASA